MYRRFKFKRLSIKKIDKILNKLSTLGIINCKDFIKILDKEHKPLEYIDFKLVAPIPILQIFIKHHRLNNFITIPVTLVKDDIDSYNKFLEYWEMFRKEWNNTHTYEHLPTITDMMEMNTKNFNRFAELLKLGLHRTAGAFLTNTKVKNDTTLNIVITTHINNKYTIDICSRDTLGIHVRFDINLNNPEQFINEWNEFRNEHFVNNNTDSDKCKKINDTICKPMLNNENTDEEGLISNETTLVKEFVDSWVNLNNK